MKRIFAFAIFFIFVMVFAGCFGTGKTDREAAAKVSGELNEKYPEALADVKAFRDKLEIAFTAETPVMIRSQIMMDAAFLWWNSYPNDKKPRHTLTLRAYDLVISDDDIGGLTINRGISPDKPKIKGEPGIYSLRDIK